ncbi:hypothetical protein LBMAG53_03080 [Planctomycetota bacterium]|nr:hypothetical protein LBMAG53_03080 [Planctomycetota bacterium]
MRTTHVLVASTILAAAFMTGCGGKVVGDDKDTEQVYTGISYGAIAKGVAENWPIQGKNPQIDGQGNMAAYNSSYSNVIWVRNSLNRLRRRVNVDGAHAAEPLVASAMLHSGYMITEAYLTDSESTNGLPDGPADTTNLFNTKVSFPDRIQSAILAYNEYNEPAEVPGAVGWDGTALKGSDIVLNPDFPATEYDERLHMDNDLPYLWLYGREGGFYEIPATIFDPTNNYNRNGFNAKGSIDATVLETWNLLYGRLPMMRHRFTLMGYGGRMSLKGGVLYYDYTEGGLIDWLVNFDSYFDAMVNDGNANATNKSMFPAYIPKLFGKDFLDKQDLARTAAENANDPPNFSTLTFAGESGVLTTPTSWPTYGESGVWLGYHVLWDVAVPPGLNVSPDETPLGIPIHFIFPITQKWDILQVSLHESAIPKNGAKPIEGRSINAKVLYGGQPSSISGSGATFDPVLEIGEVFLVPDVWLDPRQVYLVKFSGLSGGSNIVGDVLFTTGFRIGYDDQVGPFRK